MTKGAREEQSEFTPGWDDERRIGDDLAVARRELTDPEVIEIWESTVSGVRDGMIPTFDDKGALIQDVMRRLGR